MIKDLTEIGYKSEEWTIISPEIAKEVEAFPGWQNNMYAIYHRKVSKKYPKGSKVAKLKFLEENQIDFGEKTETIEVEAKEVNPDIEAIGNAKSLDDLKDLAKGNPNMKIIGDTEVPSPIEATSTIERINQYEDLGFIVQNGQLIKEDISLEVTDIKKMTEEEFKASIEKVKPKEKRICRECKKDQSFEPDLQLNVSKDGLICNKCAGIIWNDFPTDEVETTFKEMRKNESNRIKQLLDLGFVASTEENSYVYEDLKFGPVGNTNDYTVDEWKALIIRAEELIKKDTDVPKVETPVTNNETLEINKEKSIGHFGVVDELMETLVAFKQVFYAISVVKETIDSDLTPAKKVSQIKAAVKNIKMN